jgi:hypothetical protein
MQKVNGIGRIKNMERKTRTPIIYPLLFENLKKQGVSMFSMFFPFLRWLPYAFFPSLILRLLLPSKRKVVRNLIDGFMTDSASIRFYFQRLVNFVHLLISLQRRIITGARHNPIEQRACRLIGCPGLLCCDSCSSNFPTELIGGGRSLLGSPMQGRLS